MQVFNSIEDIPFLISKPVVSIGNFDGVHLGHQALLAKAKQEAQAIKSIDIVITFDPHPLTLLRPDMDFHLICSLARRLELMEEYGVDLVLCLNFNAALANLSPEEFVVNLLINGLQASHVVEGYDFNFGRGGKGNLDLLADLGNKYAFVLHKVGPIMVDGAPASSSRVRKAVAVSDFTLARKLLGRPFELTGQVIPGYGRGGHDLNMHTANLNLDNDLLPPEGVYVCQVKLPDNTIKPGVFNLGTNPTYGDVSQARLEVHIIGYDQNLYDQAVTVYPVSFLRKEIKFDSITDLKNQMNQDLVLAKQILQKNES